MKKTLVLPGTHDWHWIDLEGPTAEELKELAAEYKLHRTSVTDSLQPEHLPKFETVGDVAFMIARVYDSAAQREADTIQELTNKVAIFFSERFIITIHRGSAGLIQEVKEKYADTGVINKPSELLIKLIKTAFRTYEVPARKLAEELDYYEAKTFLNQRTPPLTKGLYHLKRKASVCRRVLSLSEVILSNMHLSGFRPTDVQDLRDYFVHVQTQFDEVNDGTNNLISTYLSLSSQRTNEVMRVLTVFSAFFLPLTFIVGVYGMNFEFMPELEEKYGYPAVIGVMVIVTFSIYQWFRRKGWL
ncbi:magnesium transporter [Pontibacter aydingkolensis]|uniref:Magnesium transporter CorA n=1 Tax=Pontibacter aydingkolensis TaxID=1911536 RepID=A0ABS7CZS6_9BACT|nr:CorA family divalent cation transporter [Pontibacter aydingkolensis]MBW7469342.1 magnesium transporter CorA [Pontibacter aydingkolensis]